MLLLSLTSHEILFKFIQVCVTRHVIKVPCTPDFESAPDQCSRLHSRLLVACPSMARSGAHRKYKAQRDSHKTQAGRYVAHSGAAYKVQAHSHQSEPTLVPNLRGFAWPQAQEPQGCWLLDFQLSRWILLVTNDISGGGEQVYVMI